MILNIALLGCGNWKSLILEESSEGASSTVYPTVNLVFRNYENATQDLSVISVKNADNVEIGQINLDQLSLSTETIFLHTDSFPNKESVAKDITFSVLNNELSPPNTSSSIPNPANGFKEMSFIKLSVDLEGVLSFDDQQFKINYQINFSTETFLFNDDDFTEIFLEEQESDLIIELNTSTWFQFSDEFSDAQIQDHLQNLGTNSESQKFLQKELLVNIQNSFVFGIDANNNSQLDAEERNNNNNFGSSN